MGCSLPAVHGIPRQEYWSGLPFPSPGGLPSPGTERASLTSPALAGRFITMSATWEVTLTLSANFSYTLSSTIITTSLVAQTVKCLPTMLETWVQSLGWEDLLEKEMAIHFSILGWKIPWTEEPGRLQSIGSKQLDKTEATSHALQADSASG